MSKPGIITEIAASRGMTEQELLKQAVENAGSVFGAAKELADTSGMPVFPTTIRRALKKHGLKVKQQRTATVEERASE